MANRIQTLIERVDRHLPIDGQMLRKWQLHHYHYRRTVVFSTVGFEMKLSGGGHRGAGSKVYQVDFILPMVDHLHEGRLCRFHINS